jgi:MFS family permease
VCTVSPPISRSAWTLVTLCAVLGLDGMDVASMSPALPEIQDDLGMSATSLQWVVSAYVIGYGGFVLLGVASPTCSRRDGC